MRIQLVRVKIDEAKDLWEMQVRAFLDLYEKYQDAETSPATESMDQVLMRLHQPFTYYYYIVADNTKVGAIRVVDRSENGVPKRISPIFILPEYRNKGFAQKAIQLAEELHGSSHWELDTILQEKGHCDLYEKMGYCQTGKTIKGNENLTLVFYKKDSSHF